MDENQKNQSDTNLDNYFNQQSGVQADGQTDRAQNIAPIGSVQDSIPQTAYVNSNIEPTANKPKSKAFKIVIITVVLLALAIIAGSIYLQNPMIGFSILYGFIYILVPLLMSASFYLLIKFRRKSKGEIADINNVSPEIKKRYKKYKNLSIIIFALIAPAIIISFIAAGIIASGSSEGLGAGIFALIIFIFGICATYLILSVALFVVLLKFVKSLNKDVKQEPQLAPQFRAAAKGLNSLVTVVFFLSLIPLIITLFIIASISTTVFQLGLQTKDDSKELQSISTQISGSSLGTTKITNIKEFDTKLLAYINSKDTAGISSMYWAKDNKVDVAEEIQKMTAGIPATKVNQIYKLGMCHVDTNDNTYVEFDIRPVASTNNYYNYSIVKENSTGYIFLVTEKLNSDSTSLYTKDNPFRGDYYCPQVFGYDKYDSIAPEFPNP